MEARPIEIMKAEVKLLADMKIGYLDTFDDLILTQLSGLIHALKATYYDYGRSTIAE